jgi:predicted permease
VSASLFEMLGVRPAIGRVFNDAEERESVNPQGERVVVLSHVAWRTYFGGDPGLVGATAVLNGRPHRILGVMPDGFGFPSIANPDALTSVGAPADAPEFWMPLALRPTTARGGMVPTTYALLNPGYSAQAAAAELNAITPPRRTGASRMTLEVVDLRAEAARNRSQILWTFQAGVALVLLIACVNVVHLLRARATQRAQQMWIRLSVGATRYALVRAAVTESLLLTVTGGAVGALLAYVLVGMFRSVPPYVLPRLSEVRVDLPVLIFTAALAVVSGLVVGLVGMLRATASRSHGQQSVTPKRPSVRLVVVEVAVAVLLLVAGGLLVNSSVNLSRVDLGIQADNALAFRINVPGARYPDMRARELLYDTVVARLDAIPGVEAVGITVNGVATETASIRWPLIIGDRKYESPTLFRDVSPGYFAALGIPVLTGREFTKSDRPESPRTVIVNREFALAYLGRANVVGERFTFGDDKDLEVVGVVGAVRTTTGASAAPLQMASTPPQVYLPAPYLMGPRALAILRTSGDPMTVASSVRAAIRDVDSSLVVFDVEPLKEQVHRSMLAWKLYATVSTGFAILATFLAAMGLYGVLTHSVGLRIREFGIRTALGAAPSVILTAVMREGLAATALGVTLGLAGALLTSRFLEALLFGIEPLDTTTFAAVAILFVVVGALACYLPARRATRVDPVIALRAD